ncbi:hypothetical protein EFM24_09225 [Limosilactobacillus fermentum]|uniref:helix-turn-helix domain-containing protein n=1 Tax=Limosilactobacillus fermentum TaxID=1613 RepID=UPI0021A35992|nr:helix-turn-helix transcriptional regulator [Limosilactobacillus fermentum]MCT2875859.1 hypothetical protein [Limosilactobacillus fermentum]
MIFSNLSTLLAQKQLTIADVNRGTGINRITLTSLARNDGQFTNKWRGPELRVINKVCEYLKVDLPVMLTFIPYDLTIVFPDYYDLNESTTTRSLVISVDVFQAKKKIKTYELKSSLENLKMSKDEKSGQPIALAAKNIKIKGHEFEASEWFTDLPEIAKSALRKSLLAGLANYFAYATTNDDDSLLFTKETRNPDNIDIL